MSQSKYSLIKQNTANYFSDYANILRATGHKYFGQSHNGFTDNIQFEKEISNAMQEKHPVVQNSAYNKLIIRSWNPQKESLIDYMNDMGVSSNVIPYVLDAQNYIVSSFDIPKLESKEQNMQQVIANITNNMDKLEARAEKDNSLSENEVVAVIIATTAAKSVTRAIVDVTTEFFSNLNIANSTKLVSLRGFWNFVKAVVNVVSTIIYRTFIAPTVFIFNTLQEIGDLINYGNFDIFGNYVINSIESYIYGISHYQCYLPDDGWQCQ